MTLSVPGGTTAPSLALADPRPDLQRGDLAEAPGHGRPDVAPLDLIFQPLARHAGDGNLSFELGDIEPEPLQACPDHSRASVGPVPSG